MFRQKYVCRNVNQPPSVSFYDGRVHIYIAFSHKMSPVFKEVTLQPKIFLDLFLFDKENVVYCKQKHQGSRFMIDSAKGFPQKVRKVQR